MLAEQEAGIGAFYVLVAEDGSVLGRFNLVFAGDGTAELGYRVAQHVAGRGVATATVRSCASWPRRERASHAQGGHLPPECRVPEGTGQGRVRPCWPAGPADLGGKSGTWYQRDLAAD